MGNAVYYHSHKPYIEGIVTKTGRKYDYIKADHREIRLKKETNIACAQNDCNAYYMTFKDLNEYENWCKAEKLYAFLHHYFQPHQRRKKLSHNTLTAICLILKRNDPESVEPIQEFLPDLSP